MNQRPSGYEGLSAPRKSPTRKEFLNFIKQIMYKSVHFFSKFLLSILYYQYRNIIKKVVRNN